MAYAETTNVSVEKSRNEIERTLQRYGADEFAYATSSGRAMIAFKMNDRNVRFILPLPDRADRKFWYTPTRGTQRTEAQAFEQWEQACRVAWRALNLAIKAKLEAVEAGIVTFETEFLAHIGLPDGSTVGDLVVPQVEATYNSGTALPGISFFGELPPAT